jgi:ABC-type multidrug transport system ATPase subunit
MKKGSFIYSGTVRELLSEAKGHIWICHVKNEEEARALEKTYHVSSKQYDGDGMQVKIISDREPEMDCIASDVSLEDAYIYISSRT